jgi:polar amino acid transport system substrate-binding protein
MRRASRSVVAIATFGVLLYGCTTPAGSTPATASATPSTASAAPSTASAAPSTSFTQGKDLDRIRAKGTFVVGVTTDPPWDSPDGTGIVPDIALEFAKREGLGQIEFVSMPFASLITSIPTGRIDMIGETLYNTAERAKIIGFADPLFFNPEGLIVATGNPKKLLTHADFDNGVTIAVVEGSLYVGDLQADIAKGQDVKIMTVADNATVQNSVIAGQADGGLFDLTQETLALQTNPDLKFEIVPEYGSPDPSKTISTISFAKDSDLIAAFNKVFADMTKEGAIDAILTKHGLVPGKHVVSPDDPEYVAP